MTMTMIEKVARAIDPELWAPREDGTTWGSDIALTDSKRRALAALEAIREPSEGMVEAMEATGVDWSARGEKDWVDGVDYDMRKAWQAGIDHALLAERPLQEGQSEE